MKNGAHRAAAVVGTIAAATTVMAMSPAQSTSSTPSRPRLLRRWTSPPSPGGCQGGDTDETGEPSTQTRAAGIPALAIGVFGIIVGLAWSLRPSIWYDEAATLSAIRRSPGEILQLVSSVDAVHAAYYLTAWAWSQVLGDGIASLRGLSAVGLGVTAASVFLLVDRLLSRRAALWSGAVAVLLPGLSWAGLEGRSYAWSAALAVLATYALVLACERGGVGRWTAYAVLVTLMIWWSFFAVLMLLVHGVALVTTERRMQARRPTRLRPWALAAAAASAACLPLAALVHAQSRQLQWIQQTPGEVLQGGVLRQVVVGQRHNSPGLAPHELAAAGVGVVIVCAVIGWLRASSTAEDPFARPLVLAWAVLPTLVLAGSNLWGAQVYQARYLTFSAPAIAIAVGAGLASLPIPVRALLAVLGCVLVLPVLVALRAGDAKAGDDYQRLARVAMDAHADLVVFDRAGLRGIEIAYPNMFRATRDVSMAASPRRTRSLWGHNLRPRQLSRRVVAERTVVLYLLKQPGPRRFPSRLHQLGCTTIRRPVSTTRADALVLRC